MMEILGIVGFILLLVVFLFFCYVLVGYAN